MREPIVIGWNEWLASRAAKRAISAAGAVLADGTKVSVSRRALPELRKAYLLLNCR